MLVGPTLNRFSALKPEEVHNLLVYSSADPINEAIVKSHISSGSSNAKSSSGNGASSAAVDELTDQVQSLKEQNAKLIERIDVLERMAGYSEK